MKLEDSAYSGVLKELEDSDNEALSCMEALYDTIQAENNPPLVNVAALIATLAIILEDLPGPVKEAVVQLLPNAIKTRRKNGSTIH
jgi:hypothetical protein